MSVFELLYSRISAFAMPDFENFKSRTLKNIKFDDINQNKENLNNQNSHISPKPTMNTGKFTSLSSYQQYDGNNYFHLNHISYHSSIRIQPNPF